ncbi:MAG: CPBP family intramembrane metalloprotease [Opitutaceae bacterium]|nr:CPBP family intramembrane metalloprotease [Opitutaceae bacterium]
MLNFAGHLILSLHQDISVEISRSEDNSGDRTIMLLQEIINTLIQLIMAFVIAGLAYALAGKSRGRFAEYIGLIRPTGASVKLAALAALVLVPVSLALFYFTPLKAISTAENTVTGALRNHGFGGEAVLLIVIVALIKTSFTEEIIFRGVVAKRLIRWWGLGIGNTVHATLFAGVHLVIFVAPGGPAFNPVLALAILVITGTGAWVQAWLNERRGNGSIGPGWLIHAATNLISYPILAYL